MLASNRRLALGTFAMGATNFVKIGIQLVMLPLMARLLGPSEYGLYSLAMPIVLFVMMLADGGLGASLAREPETNTDVWSSATWALLLSGSIMAGIVIGSSYLLAATSREPRLPGVMTALAGGLILFVLSIPSNARLVRRGRLELCALVDVVGNVLGAVFAIILALHHTGAWSLVGQTLTLYATRFLLSTLFAPAMPALHFSVRDLTTHLAMGSTIIGGKLVDTGDKSVENALMRRNFGASELGSYSIANQIPAFICGSISNALWATLYAQTLRAADDSEIIRNYRNMLRVLGLVLFPMSALAAAQGQQLIALLLGNRWGAVSPMLQILLISTTINSAFVFGQSILYAKGAATPYFRITAESAFIRIIAVLAAPWIGILGLTLGLAGAGIFMGFRSLTFIKRAIGMKVAAILSQLIWPAVSAATAGLVCWLASERLPHSLYFVFGNLVFSGLLYLAILLALERHTLIGDLRNLMRLVRPVKKHAVPISIEE
jgi:O-antigen/teichoic acid export membrane protein